MGRSSAQMRRWQQAFFFEVLLVAGISMCWVVYLFLSTTILEGVSKAPLITCAVMLVLHMVVLQLLGRLRTELHRACVLGAALVVDTACMALLHPKLQQLWLPLLGMASGPCQAGENSEACQSLESFDYRYNGPLIYQCFLIYNVLLLLQGRCALFASTASVTMYFGLLALGGADVHFFDLAVVILPAFIGLVAKKTIEELGQQVDSLVAELDGRAAEESAVLEALIRVASSQGRREVPEMVREVLAAVSSILSPQAAAERSAATSSVTLGTTEASAAVGSALTSVRAGRHRETHCAIVGTTETSTGTANSDPEKIRKWWTEASAAVRSALSSLRADRHSEAILGTTEIGAGTASDARQEAASSSNCHDTTLSFSISSSSNTKAAAQTSTDGLVGSAAPRRAPATCESSTQTWMSWENDGFHCTRCAKPPLLPRPQALGLRSERRIIETSDSDDSLSEDSRAGGCKILRFPGLQRTPVKSEQILLISCILAWNIKMRPGACCSLHAGIFELQRVALRLQALPCKGEPFAAAYQCQICGACSEMHLERCTWCSSDRVSRTPYVTARAASPVQL